MMPISVKSAPWWERYGGLGISVFLFALLFAKLWLTVYSTPAQPTDLRPIRVMLRPVAPPDAAVPSRPVPPTPPEVAATRELDESADNPMEAVTASFSETEESVPSNSQTQPTDSTASDEAPVDAAAPEPLFLMADEAPQPAEPEQPPLDLEQSRRRAESLADSLEREKSEIRQFLARERLAIRAEKFDFSSQGATEGAVRTIDITHVPEQAAELVFKRYGIRIVKRYLQGNEGGGFLNAAKTRHGVYTNRSGAGLFEVFEVSPRAQARMTELELQALRSRGLNPAQTQVLEVVFSVAQVNDEWDLVIRTFKARPIK